MIQLSILVPTYNKANYLDRLLQSIAEQTFPQAQFEVVIVDDGSTDHTRAVVDKHLGRISNLHYHHQGHRGVAAARNAGIQLAKGELLAFLADDYVIPTNYCQQLLGCFLDANIEVVKPRLTTSGTTLVEQANLLLYNVHLWRQCYGEDLPTIGLPKSIRFPDSLFKMQGTCDLSGAAMMRRSLFDRFGLFNEELQTGEDTEMGMRLKRQGVHMHLLPKIYVDVFFRRTWRSSLRRAYTYGHNGFLIKTKFSGKSQPQKRISNFRKYLQRISGPWRVSLYSGSFIKACLLYPYIFLHSLCYAWGYRGILR